MDSGCPTRTVKLGPMKTQIQRPVRRPTVAPLTPKSQVTDEPLWQSLLGGLLATAAFILAWVCL